MTAPSTSPAFERSIQIDPTFPYYLARSPESIADELLLAGYRVVHLFVTNEFAVDAGLVRTLRKRGLEVWALTLGNGSFVTSHLPAGWEAWRMGLLKMVDDGYARLSPFCTGYVAWKKEALARLVRTVPFDGLEIAEPYLPEWNGLASGTYGDVGPHAQTQFKRRFGEDIPEFLDSQSPKYYKKLPALYAQWVRFRIDGVNDYIDEIVNGVRGVRDSSPGIRIATWTLAVDDGPQSLERLRELQGNDAVSMIAKVKPDLHYLQTHWPDWGRELLRPDYVRGYRQFVDAIRRAFPRLPIGVQTDIGSAKRMIRSSEWMITFEKEVKELGCSASTAYEYHLGGSMYDEAPRLLRAERLSRDTVRLTFQKRVAPPKPADIAVLVRSGAAERRLNPADIETDGNRLTVRSPDWPTYACEVAVRGIADTPELLLYPPSVPKLTVRPQWLALPGI